MEGFLQRVLGFGFFFQEVPLRGHKGIIYINEYIYIHV